MYKRMLVAAVLVTSTAIVRVVVGRTLIGCLLLYSVVLWNPVLRQEEQIKAEICDSGGSAALGSDHECVSGRR